MDELIKLVAKKINVPEDKAKQAVETVLGFIKNKLPEPFAKQVDGLLSGDLNAGDAMGALGGLLGKK